jgi:hypothetical protein
MEDNIINREFKCYSNNEMISVLIGTLPLILLVGGMMFLAFFLSFGIIGKILLVASIVFYIYRHITRTVVKVFFDLEELRIKMISGAWYTIPYPQIKEYYSVRMTQGFTKELFFTFFLNAKKITKAFSVVCPDELEEELGAFLKGKVKKVRY